MATPTETTAAAEDDLFSEGNAPTMETDTEDDTETTEEGDEGKSNSGTPTALVPKDVVPSDKLELGKVCQFKVTRILDGQIELEYQAHKTKQDETETETEMEPEEDMENMY
jgi:hypothetical protein